MSLKEYQINPWVVMAVFTALVAPFALSFHMHFPDEMYYTDAAVKMLQNGDYLTTYLGNNELRFRKPIGTYWVVLAGFKLFGVSAFSSRIFFLLAGALTVGASYWLAKVLFEDRKIAGISALIIASNPVLIFAATRSIPDVLLGLFMTLSAVGFAGLIRYGDQSPKKYLWILYLSLGIAFEVKGLPAVALGGIGILYLLANPWKRVSFKTFIHLPSLIPAIVIALFWFVAMYLIHGPTYLDSFLQDQVGGRVASRYLLILKNGFLATIILLAVFIPWVLLVFPKLKESLIKVRSENLVFFGFAILWGLAILGMGAMTTKFYERYLLPVSPVLAVFLAWILVRGNFEGRQLGLKISSWFFLILSFIVGAFGFYLNFQLGSSAWIYIQLLAGLIIWAYLLSLTLKKIKLPKAISYGFLLVFFLLSTATAKISLPEQGEQFAKFVKTNSIDSTEPIGFIGNIHTSSKIRVYLGTEFYMTDLTGEKSITDEQIKQKAEKFSHLIVEDKYLEKLDTAAYVASPAAVNWDSKRIPFLLQNLGDPNFKSLLQENGKIYYWLKKK
ncbi:ArnT family glycosyltransferase [Algoriphagus pacificus]|uniref:Glycosyltransferase family 39 protein n=1 Tax=Algoriphagus pacificus TaxID=2811234 RepID=A0ABS3CGU7_9BACT|nr:glycosyltransferase family 39 protein [Algoriphagus pacificus]MBN7814854.1 glycosyltransferase family 39 protein [Algoriphagus pacificus]